MTAGYLQVGLLDAAPPTRMPMTDALPMLAWRDDDKKKPTAEKVQDAIDRFRQKHRVDPTFVMTSAADAADLAGFEELAVEAKTFIAKGNYYVGVKP